MTGRYNLVEAHVVLQGEGRLAGVPHILVRFAGCNLRCSFSRSICDTPYASYAPDVDFLGRDDLELLFHEHPRIKHTMITGGEPFMQPNQLEEIAQIAASFGHTITVETNGSRPKFIKELNHLSISPKLSNSVPLPGDYRVGDEVIKLSLAQTEAHRLASERMPETVKEFLHLYGDKVYLKFVYSGMKFLPEIVSFVEKVGIDYNQVYLMPEGVTREQLSEFRVELFNICMSTGFRYSDRLQILAFGNKRGT